ncbi:hypothetical protein RND71_015653 [Anisodus tanguticus]|uniref:Phytocyanin domain-containing protein n=1 Tax=Anisodus tanguticus TaxID=243964 RepID=A0AAE1S6P6_9SOLA|nr:hypothetical protein RND71_015653 [Anisodus tanguticus]
MAVGAAIFVFVLFVCPMAFAKDRIVGGNDGWSQSVDYSNWASGETFSVGDNLVFNYAGNHGVNVVSKDAYENCNTGNAIQVHTGGETSIPLSSAGDMYFVCPTLNHCDTGMKLAIKIQGSSSGTKSNPPNGASGVFGNMSKLVVGFSVVLGALFAFMG